MTDLQIDDKDWDGNSVPCCATCQFRQPDERPEYVTSGRCQRFPPVPYVFLSICGNVTYEQHWPWMNATDWCGEYVRG